MLYTPTEKSTEVYDQKDRLDRKLKATILPTALLLRQKDLQTTSKVFRSGHV